MVSVLVDGNMKFGQVSQLSMGLVAPHLNGAKVITGVGFLFIK